MSDDNVIDFNKFRAERDAAKKQVTDAKNEEDLQTGVSTLVDLMERQDAILTMLVSDMAQLNHAMMQARMQIANAMATIGALTVALDEKGIMSAEEVKKVWERDYLPLLQGKKPAQSPIILPSGGGKILTP